MLRRPEIWRGVVMRARIRRTEWVGLEIKGLAIHIERPLERVVLTVLQFLLAMAPANFIIGRRIGDNSWRNREIAL